MKAYDVRQYWIGKYEDTFDEEYVTEKASVELFLLKKLLDRYNYYLLLEAIDRFFGGMKKEKASIFLFVSKNFFSSFFSDLIKEKDIIHFKRLLPWYSPENQLRIRELMQLYRNYLYALSLSKEDLNEMSLILEELKNIPCELENFN